MILRFKRKRGALRICENIRFYYSKTLQISWQAMKQKKGAFQQKKFEIARKISFMGFEPNLKDSILVHRYSLIQFFSKLISQENFLL